MGDVLRYRRKLEVQNKRLAGQNDTRERKPNQQQDQREKQYRESHSVPVLSSARGGVWNQPLKRPGSDQDGLVVGTIKLPNIGETSVIH
jgi:hypothetical protein